MIVRLWYGISTEYDRPRKENNTAGIFNIVFYLHFLLQNFAHSSLGFGTVSDCGWSDWNYGWHRRGLVAITFFSSNNYKKSKRSSFKTKNCCRFNIYSLFPCIITTLCITINHLTGLVPAFSSFSLPIFIILSAQCLTSLTFFRPSAPSSDLDQQHPTASSAQQHDKVHSWLDYQILIVIDFAVLYYRTLTSTSSIQRQQHIVINSSKVSIS